MIKSFKDKDTEKLFYEGFVRHWVNISEKASMKLMILDNASSLDELKMINSNRFHKLVGDRKNQYSISVNLQYRVCFEWIEGNAYNVELTDHYR